VKKFSDTGGPVYCGIVPELKKLPQPGKRARITHKFSEVDGIIAIEAKYASLLTFKGTPESSKEKIRIIETVKQVGIGKKDSDPGSALPGDDRGQPE
jgi:hypothetical protein